MHEKRGGSLGNPLEKGTIIIPCLAWFQASLVDANAIVGLGARADLRSCSEWYKNNLRNSHYSSAKKTKSGRSTGKNIIDWLKKT